MSLFPEKKFEIDMPTNGGISILLCGSTRSGKTTALAHILETYFKKHVGVLFTESPQASIYKQMDIVQCPCYEPKIVKTMYQINRDTKNHYPFLVVLDDLVTAKFDKELLKTLTIYRNSQISCIVSAQALTLFNSAGRTNINIVILMKLNSDEQIEKCVKAYLGSYFPPNTRMLDKLRIYKELTEDHHFFCINNLTGDVFVSKINIED